jgi:hypothetical protein
LLVLGAAGICSFGVAAARILAAGSRTRLARIEPLRWWEIAVACLALRFYFTLGPGLGWDSHVRTGLLLGTHLVIALVAAANLRRPWRAGMAMALAGMLLNILVMATNGGLMPVSPETLVQVGNGHVLQRVSAGQALPRSKDVILPWEETRFAVLSDWLIIPGWRGSFSPGDFVVAAGIFLVMQAAVAMEHGRQPT